MKHLTRISILVILLQLALVSAVVSAQPLPPPASPDEAAADWMAHNHLSDLPHDHVLVEGDIVMPAGIVGTRATYHPAKWPNGVVYYTFHGSIEQSKRNKMRAAMDEWESVAGVTFLPRSGQPGFIEIIESGGNWSSIGYTGGKQQLSIVNWNYHYVIMHELAHALGMWHEQSRPDRDSYVTINWGNVQSGLEHNFNIVASARTVGSYDFCSVMHYGPGFFSKNGQPTISAKPAYAGQASCMGNQSYLTAKDKAGMQALYPQTQPALPGDTPQTAVGIPADANFSYSASAAVFTAGPSDPKPKCLAAGTSVGHTAWFRIQPGHDHLLTMNASGYNTVLAVYMGNPGKLKPQACVDDHSSGGIETLTLPIESGKTYYVMIGGVGGSTGTLNFSNTQHRSLIDNGGFDLGVAGWNIKSTRGDDARKCGLRGVYNSKCAFEVTGGKNEKTTLKTTLTANKTGWNFATTRDYVFSMMVKNAKAAGAVSAKIVVKYADKSKQTATLAIDGYTDGYQAGAVNLTLSGAPVKNVKIVITASTRSGKSWIDNVVFRPQASGLGLKDAPLAAPADAGALALPAAPADDFRGAN